MDEDENTPNGQDQEPQGDYYLEEEGPAPEQEHGPGEQEQEDAWAWASDLDPDEVRQTFENQSEMRRRANERNEQSARELEQARRERQEAETMRREAMQALAGGGRRRRHQDDDWDLDDEDDDFGSSSGRRRDRALERRLEQMEQRHQQELNEMRFRTESARAESAIRDVLRSDEKLRPVVDFYGEDKAAELYLQRAFNDPSIRPDQVRSRAREWAEDDTAQIRAFSQRLLREQVRGKARAQQSSIGTPSGPRRPVRSNPNRTSRKIDWTRDIPQDVELSELERAFADVEREAGDR